MSSILKIYTENPYLREYYDEKAVKQFHEGDSGFDLIFPSDITINPGDTYLAKLGIHCSMSDHLSKNLSYLLMPRSSIIKTKLRMANSIGLIDAGYRGEICAAIDNIGKEPHNCKKGDRLFQIVSPNLAPFNVDMVNTKDDLGITTRGDGGFGSTNQILG